MMSSFLNNWIINMNKILLVDFSALSNATFFAIFHDPQINNQDELLDFWRHTLFNSILTKKKIIKPDEIVLAIDSKSWREDYFPYYKARRKIKKQQDEIDYQFFYDASNKMIEEIKQYFPWKVIKENSCEGDDILTILAYELHKENEIVLLSSDKDIKQLLVLNNVSFYSYRNDQFESVDNPLEYSLRLILGGDFGDDIPNVLSDSDTFITEGKRQKQCGSKKVDKILEEGITEFIERNKLQENWKRNKTLIELSEQTIPENLWNNVLTQYKMYDNVKPDFINILTFLQNNNLRSLQDKIEEFF